MRLKFDPSLIDYELADLLAMPPEEVVALAWRQREALRLVANRLGEELDDQFAPAVQRRPLSARRAGQAGLGRRRTPAAPSGKAGKPVEKNPAGPRQTAWLERVLARRADRDERGSPARAERLRRLRNRARSRPEAPMRGRHNRLELTRGEMSLQVTASKHIYFAARCSCGRDNVERPGVGLRSDIEGRRRNLLMSERCLVGPVLATFIAALSLRFRMSHNKIREFLHDWLGLELGVATIERCIHEFGLASEKAIVEQLIQDVRAADIVHIDETPWYQGGDLHWIYSPYYSDDSPSSASPAAARRS